MSENKYRFLPLRAHRVLDLYVIMEVMEIAHSGAVVGQWVKINYKRLNIGNNGVFKVSTHVEPISNVDKNINLMRISDGKDSS